ncbi:CheR family methyltransferase [Hydrogenovibrio halophilus]|uniref:CheR family methyltransferase n=1 Tax=Hydrogenovibrio halophilus TaxID=373391 RepID=UPI00038200A2|nr:CheR family methyltransferase [Hydrogenovibrio halophilus]
MTEQPYWLFLGASAGGLEALKQFLLHFRAYDRCCVVIAQHLDPKHPTILKDLLERVTETPIEMVDKPVRPQAGRVYIISPGFNAQVHDHTIELTPAAAVGPKPSIDVLLHSAAEALQEQAVVGILSGTGSDGARGAMAIKSNNGLVFAQNESTARYAGMPLAAVEAGAVDKTGSPQELAEDIAAFLETGHKDYQSVRPDPKTDLEKIFQRIYDVTGHDFSGYKLKTIRRRLARRMAVNQLSAVKEYVHLIETSEDEVQHLFKDMMISVTAFFRDREAFQALETLLENAIREQEEDRPWRIWVPGCANGEEPYSIAIVMHRIKTRLNRDIEYQIFASDIDEYALSQARKGVFSEAQVMDMDPEVLDNYFIRRDRTYQLSKKVRDRVVFARQNLIMEPPFSRLDLISCRNLMIYFSTELQRQVLQTFHFALNPQGLLFMGKSESASSTAPQLFETLDKKAQLYQRKATNLSQRSDRIQSANAIKRQERPTAVTDTDPEEKQTIAHKLEQTLLNDMVPVAIVVDKSGQILHIRGDVNRYLNFPQGRIDTNMLTLARDDIKVDLRALMEKAKKDGEASSQALFYKDSDQDMVLFLSIKRMRFSESHNNLYVVAFIPTELSLPFVEPGGGLTSEQHASKKQLQKEVAVFKERLQASVEDLETTNEELQSTNEELQSSNEELQSSNEELQTANEELQSTNEELSTVNEELEVKTHELEQVNTDLQSMLENMSEHILLLDSRLRLLRFTRPASELFSLDSSHLHQTVTTLGLELDVPNLRQELLSVLENDRTNQLRVRVLSDVFCLRLVPHQSPERGTRGVLMFFDRPGQSMDQNGDQAEQMLRLLGEQLGCGLVVIDQNGVMTYANQQIRTYLGYDWDDMALQNVKMLMPDPYRSHHDSYLEDYQKGENQGLIGQWRDVTAQKKDGRRRLLKLRTEEIRLHNECYYLGFLKPTEGAHE